MSRKASALDKTATKGDEIRDSFAYTTGLDKAQTASFMALSELLDNQFSRLDSQAAGIISRAKSGLRDGDLIPPPPAELDGLQAQKQALIGNLATILGERLSKEINNVVNAYLARSMSQMQPVSNTGNSAPTH